jgi:hypothetical protein
MQEVRKPKGLLSVLYLPLATGVSQNLHLAVD